jgi:antitoxin component of MazEF toxin-antitoxin module
VLGEKTKGPCIVCMTKGAGRVSQSKIEQRSLVAEEEEYTLEELLTGINKNNLHAEIDFGPRVGKEVW